MARRSTPQTQSPGSVASSARPLWTRYRVTWTFLTKLCGSVPAAPELVAAWLNARAPTVKPPDSRSIQQLSEEVLGSLLTDTATAEDEERASLLTFQRQNGHVVMRAATIRAHIKDCARVLSTQYFVREQGEKAFSTKVINGAYLDQSVYWIPVLGEDGQPVTDTSGFFDKGVHIKGPRGTHNALKRIEFIAPPSAMTFDLQVLGESIHEDDLHILFQYGGTHGYGGERGDGEGRYTYTISAVRAE